VQRPTVFAAQNAQRAPVAAGWLSRSELSGMSGRRGRVDHSAVRRLMGANVDGSLHLISPFAGRRIGTTEFYGAAVDFQPVRDAYSSM